MAGLTADTTAEPMAGAKAATKDEATAVTKAATSAIGRDEMLAGLMADEKVAM